MEITLQGLVLGLIGVAIGLGLVFRGFRLFMLLLPLLGFVGGFLVGAGLMEALFGEGFLATLLGWGVGFVFGLVMAVLSYLYYWLAVGVLGGFIGYQLTLGVLAWFGLVDPGLVAVLIAFVVGLVFGVAFLVLDMPTVVAIVGTALVGAALAVAGATLALGLAAHAELSDGVIGIYSDDELGWLGVAALIVLSLVGMVYQARALGPDDEVISPSSFRNPGIGGRGAGGGAVAA